MLRIVYSPHYNIGFCGLERLHPFDSRKYGRACRELKRRFGPRLRPLLVRPAGPATTEELRLVHSAEYLASLRNPAAVAAALELPMLGRLPGWMLDWRVLRPMRWAVSGSILAAELAVRYGVAVNLGGGFHHAGPTRGEGFCIYADAGIAVAALRRRGILAEQDRVVCVDTDAHQGNGVCHVFMEDLRVFLLDMFNPRIYPQADEEARRRIDCPIGVTSSTTDQEYLQTLRDRLPKFLDSVCRARVGLAIYNAGTDVVQGDPLGGLGLSPTAIRERDLFVLDELTRRAIPALMLLSGGYTRDSYRLVAESVAALIERRTAGDPSRGV